MRTLPLVCCLLLALICLMPGGASAETLTCTSPEFEVELPAGFVPLAPEEPDSALIGLYIDESGPIPVTIGFWRYGKEIRPGAGDTDDLWIMPSLGSGRLVRKYQLDWDGGKIYGAVFEVSVREGLDSYTEHTHVAWVPLKGEAVQIELAGNANDDNQLKISLQRTLDTLDGPSSSSFSSMPVEIWFVIGPMLLILVAGVGFMWIKGRRKPTATAAHLPPPVQPVAPPNAYRDAPTGPAQPPDSTPRPERPPWEL